MSMRTIYTTLPVYDKIEKQCFRRGNGENRGILGPVLTPPWQLPSMQWFLGTDVPGTITQIELLSPDAVSGSNLITTFTNGVAPNDYDTLTVVDNSINAALEAGVGDVHCQSNTFSVTEGELLTIKFTYDGSIQQHPYFSIRDGAGNVLTDDTIPGTVTDGFKLMVKKVNASASDASLHIRNTLGADWKATGVTILRGDIAGNMTTLPVIKTVSTGDYYQYLSETLQYPLPFGTYYLKMTSANGYVYYSEVFQVTCIFPNLISSWTNSTYETFTSDGAEITSAIETGAAGVAVSSSFSITKDEVIKVIYYHQRTSGQLPTISLYSGGVLIDSESIADGLNDIELTSTVTGTAEIRITNTAASNWKSSEVLILRSYSEEYLRIDFLNSCDLGDILYSEGLTQSLWFKGDNIEPTFPMTPEGAEDGNGKFIPTFRRQEKMYLIKTDLVTLAMVDCLYRLMLHDDITLTDLFGDEWTVQSLEVDHEWQGDDKVYALATLTVDLGEAVVMAGCCNNL